MTNEAILKLENELSNTNGLGHKEKAVSKPVLEALKLFCKNQEFAEAILNTEHSFSDCLKDIMKNVGNSISDIAVYEKAASFYFPNAKINFEMTIEINGADTPVSYKTIEEPKSNVVPLAPKKKIQISLDDLL